MQKLVLISIIVVSMVAPIIASRTENPRLAFRKVLLWCLVGIALYVLAVLLIYPRLNP
jgi:hypothetical protein